eukprot:CAMPEP_0182442014 /NCGR_PEP_ID=MMETSP1172-20130603/993_1 /TAXON_ID=708627 /ORGANISM="Timspurckia oligopyrenoides, Strain CCMP3278" /LENGTH=947 /DNA_ID=CAMNT_0024636679 /DNA_START=26 /DNA_END=2869 /DNA_ORIENTATION=+
MKCDDDVVDSEEEEEEEEEDDVKCQLIEPEESALLELELNLKREWKSHENSGQKIPKNRRTNSQDIVYNNGPEDEDYSDTNDDSFPAKYSSYAQSFPPHNDALAQLWMRMKEAHKQFEDLLVSEGDEDDVNDESSDEQDRLTSESNSESEISPLLEKHALHHSIGIEDVNIGALIPAPSVDSLPTRVRYENMKGMELDSVLIVYYGAIFLGVLYTIAFCVIARTRWSAQDHFQAVVISEPHIIRFLQLISILFALYYWINLWIHRTHIVDEQLWVGALLSTAFFGPNPFNIADRISSISDSHSTSPNHILNESIYTAATYFFIISSAHSFRKLQKWQQVHTWSFYAPKLSMIGCYLIFKISLSIHANLISGFIPFSRLIPFFVLLWNHRTNAIAFEALSVITILDVFIWIMIAREFVCTRRYLAKRPYFEHRTKQLGFRIFVYTNLAFAVVLVSTSCMLILGLPSMYFTSIYDHQQTFELSPQVGKLGLGIIYFAWVFLTGFMYLPSTNKVDDRQTGFTYSFRLFEWRWDVSQSNDFPIGIRSDVLVVQTLIQMLNCAWLSYLPGNRSLIRSKLYAVPTNSTESDTEHPSCSPTSASSNAQTSKHSDWKQLLPEHVRNIFPEEPEGYHVVRYICDLTTDCHVLVLEQYDRVIIAFSGSRGVQNWIHNLEFYRVEWEPTFGQFPELLSQSHLSSPTHTTSTTRPRKLKHSKNVFTAMATELRTFGGIKIHAGFAKLYSGIRLELLSVLADLYSPHSQLSRFPRYSDRLSSESRRCQTKWRPCFFTGHSLGGALAILASYDIARNIECIGIRSIQDISVLTIGCPKPGNSSFCTSYDKIVKTHWRIALASDWITKMPRFGLQYGHVGIQVLLDFRGTLLIDPSFVELTWWHVIPLSTALHSRACYLLALQAWCKTQFKTHAEYARILDLFWPWPIPPKFRPFIISEEDS